MADNNTITTVFRANIDQFSASTQEMKRYMGLVNAEFQEATAGLGKFSDSTEGLQAKLRQLDGTLAAQKKQLAALESQYNSMTDEQKANTKEGQRLATQILKQRAEVKKTEKQIDDYSQSLNDLEKAGVKTRQELAKLSKSAKQSGSEAESAAGKIAKGISKGLIAASTTIAGLAAAFLGLAESTRDYRNEQLLLETAFTQAGHSADTAKKIYSDFNAVLGNTQKSTETLQQLALMADTEEDLIKYTDILTGVYATFGKAIQTESLAEAINQTANLGKVQGALQKALEAGNISIEDFNNQLATLNTREERNALIQKTLSDLYEDAGKTYKENNKDLIENAKAQTELTQTIAELGKTAEPIATMLKKAISDLIKEIAPFINLIATGLKKAFEGSKEGAQEFAEGLSNLIKTLSDKLIKLLPQVIKIIEEIVPTLISTILENIPEIIKSIIQAVSQIIRALAKLIPQIVQEIVKAIPLIIDTILDAIPDLLEAAIEFFSAIIDALPIIIEQILKMLPSLVENISRKLAELMPLITDGALKLFYGIIEAIPQIISTLLEELPTIIAAIVKGLLEGIPELVKAGGQLLAGLFKGLLNPKAIWEAVKSLSDGIIGGIKKIFGIKSPSRVFRDEIGKNLALGIGVGFNDEMKKVEKGMLSTLSDLTPTLGIEAQSINNNNGLANQLATLLGNKNSNVVNNYSFDYKFERMETSRIALHKAVLETKRNFGG